MKKILLFCFCLLTFSEFTQAQSTANAEDTEHANESSKGEKMKALLELSDEQLLKFREVVTERRAAIKAVKENTALNEADKTAKIKAINDAREAKFKTIFTAAQFTKWAEYTAAKKKD